VAVTTLCILINKIFYESNLNSLVKTVIQLRVNLSTHICNHTNIIFILLLLFGIILHNCDLTCTVFISYYSMAWCPDTGDIVPVDLCLYCDFDCVT